MALAVVVSLNCHRDRASPVLVLNSQPQNPRPNFSDSLSFRHSQKLTPRVFKTPSLHRRLMVVNGYDEGSSPDSDKPQDNEEVDSLSVKAALSVLKFYKREISPLLQKSCRYVPTCSEYSMEAYKKYGVVKGTILTTWRICRCNPLGGSGFDPPRWFDEAALPEE